MFLFSSGQASQPDATWFAAGLTSTFPETQDHAANLAQHRRCEAAAAFQPGCKVFQVPREDPSLAAEVNVADADFETAEAEGQLKDQVLVFQYRGKFHAVDHVGSCNAQHIRRVSDKLQCIWLTLFFRNAHTRLILYRRARRLILKISAWF